MLKMNYLSLCLKKSLESVFSLINEASYWEKNVFWMMNLNIQKYCWCRNENDYDKDYSKPRIRMKINERFENTSLNVLLEKSISSSSERFFPMENRRRKPPQWLTLSQIVSPTWTNLLDFVSISFIGRWHHRNRQALICKSNKW